jgi:hypothetical protein
MSQHRVRGQFRNGSSEFLHSSLAAGALQG